MPGTAAVVTPWPRRNSRFGYAGGYPRDQDLKVKKDAGSPGSCRSWQTSRTEASPLEAVVFYLRNSRAAHQGLHDWVLSPEGQAIVSKVGYFRSRGGEGRGLADAELGSRHGNVTIAAGRRHAGGV